MVQTRLCPSGHQVPLSARYCGVCGQQILSDLTPDVDTSGQDPARQRGIGRLASMLLAILLVIAVGATALMAWQERSDLRAQADRIEQLRGDVARLSQDLAASERERVRLSSRVSRIESAAGDDLQADRLAEASLDSVFTIESESGVVISQGSGFIARRDGSDSILITNYHVVEQASTSGGTIRVIQGDRTFGASIETVSAAEDVAALRVEARLPALGISTGLPQVGDEVLVLGSPRGFEQSVSTGVVAALRAGRIQFTAPIAPGSSGGPVLNAAGEVIGISTEGARAGFAQGLFFAVPSTTICETVLRCG
jgi:putative serine protease PepD